MSTLQHFEHDIHAFDAGYVRPLLAALHLVVERGRVAIVDTGNKESLQPTLAALAELGLTPDCVDYIFLTHIHLDHAGGASLLMRNFPNARLVVHPRGAAHMVNPARLVAGVIAVYGASEFERLYGEILPIDGQRIVPATHGLTIDLAGRELLCLDTPGHARHHIAIVDRRSNSIFTGDIFGVSYRELDTDGRQYLFPTTSPVQFDPKAMHASIDLLTSYRPPVVYLTHYSELHDVDTQAAHLHRLIDAHVDIALREKNAGDNRHQRLLHAVTDLLLSETARFGCRLPTKEILEIFATDLELNAQGLGIWLDAQRVDEKATDHSPIPTTFA